MITLYQIEMSPFCDKVRRILQVKKQRYEVKNLKLLETLTRLKRLNPAGKVPTLDLDGRILSDSTEIAYALEERFPEPALVPSAPEARALVHLLEDWADESLYFYEARLRFTFATNIARTAELLLAGESGLMKRVGALAAPRKMRDVLAKQGVGRKSEAQVLGDVHRHVEAVAGWLAARDWLVGERMTLADIAVFVQLACIRSTAEGGRILTAQPTVLHWMERVDAATQP